MERFDNTPSSTYMSLVSRVFSHSYVMLDWNCFGHLQSDLGETLGDAVDVGIEAAQEAGNIGLEAVQAAPKILEEKVEFAKGLGKTVEETSGVVKEVILETIDS